MESEEFDEVSWWSDFVSYLLFYANLQAVLPEQAYEPKILKYIVATRREFVEVIETDPPIDEWPQFINLYNKLLHYAINLRMKILTAIQYMEEGDIETRVTFFQSVVSDLQSFLYLINKWKLDTFPTIEEFYSNKIIYLNSKHASLVRTKQNILNGYSQDIHLKTVLAAIEQNNRERESLMRKIESLHS